MLFGFQDSICCASLSCDSLPIIAHSFLFVNTFFQFFLIFFKTSFLPVFQDTLHTIIYTKTDSFFKSYPFFGRRIL